MLESITSLLDGCRRSAPYKLDSTPEWVASYSASDVASVARAALEEDTYSPLASASLYTNQKLELIERAGDWRTFLVKVPYNTDSISTSVDDSIMLVLSAPGPLEMSCYKVDGFPIGNDIPANMSLSDPYKISISAGDTFFVPAGVYATKVLGSLDEAVFLRFSGKMQSAYLVSFFPETLSLRAVSYGDNDLSGKQFFADLLSKVISSRQHLKDYGFTPEEMHAIGQFVAQSLQDASLPIPIQWRMCQVAARLDPKVAEIYLSNLVDNA